MILFVALEHMCDFKPVLATATAFFLKFAYMFVSFLELDLDYTLPIIITLDSGVISQGKRTLGNI